ncbi:MAG: divalent cation tolerance protein CutA [Alphaproteobacteria bacterium]|nr:divalent cation tolerance protein CutA [Alphaproteobacteria bacterium]
MDGYVSIYCTFPEMAFAKALATELLEKKLIACANFFQSEALYEWDGKMESAQEVVAFFKTREALFEEVRAGICAKHPYKVPCVVALPIGQGHLPYLDWVKTVTKNV